MVEMLEVVPIMVILASMAILLTRSSTHVTKASAGTEAITGKKNRAR
jgi:hypothetical protein